MSWRSKRRKKPTKKGKRDFNLVSDTMTTTLTAGAKILQDEYDMSDHDSGMWAIKTAILLNESLGMDVTALQGLLVNYDEGQHEA